MQSFSSWNGDIFLEQERHSYFLNSVAVEESNFFWRELILREIYLWLDYVHGIGITFPLTWMDEETDMILMS